MKEKSNENKSFASFRLKQVMKAKMPEIQVTLKISKIINIEKNKGFIIIIKENKLK